MTAVYADGRLAADVSPLDETTPFGPAVITLPQGQTESGSSPRSAAVPTTLLAWTGTDSRLNLALLSFVVDRDDSRLLLTARQNGPLLEDRSDAGPTLVCFGLRTFLLWKGLGNGRINLLEFSFEGGSGALSTLEPTTKWTFDEITDHAPAAVEHADGLYIAWTGVDRHLYIGRLLDDASPCVAIESLVRLDQTSDAGPALASTGERLWLAWKDVGGPELNLVYSDDNCASLQEHGQLGEASRYPPSLAWNPADVQEGRLMMAWLGIDHRLNLR